jgi:hypothetical protein
MNRRKYMYKKQHLWLKEPRKDKKRVVLKAVLESPEGRRRELWYEVPEEYARSLTASADPFVTGLIFKAMATGASLHIHGACSVTLLRNLEDFQSVWSDWVPRRYSRIALEADEEEEPYDRRSSNDALLAFSGGLDSSFTAWRHVKGVTGRKQLTIRGAVMVHGFDIPLHETEVFNNAVSKAQQMLEGMSIQLIPISSSFRDLDGKWNLEYATAVASSLMIFQKEFGKGVIASGRPYSHQLIKRGSNPLTDVMLSSNRFQIMHDGAEFTRCSKAHYISSWTNGLRNLRVCWEGEKKDRNCGKCEKCVRTILNFRVNGIDLPDCFDSDVSDEQIISLHLSLGQLVYYKEILKLAKEYKINDSWTEALDVCIRNNSSRIASADLYRSIKNMFRLRTRLRKVMNIF